jgi:hypothetical protein
MVHNETLPYLKVISIFIYGFVKRPDAALRIILPRLSPGQAYCGVHQKYASFLRIRAPCLQPFYEAVLYS